jgi:hypothetical protein
MNTTCLAATSLMDDRKFAVARSDRAVAFAIGVCVCGPDLYGFGIIESIPGRIVCGPQQQQQLNSTQACGRMPVHSRYKPDNARCPWTKSMPKVQP